MKGKLHLVTFCCIFKKSW